MGYEVIYVVSGIFYVASAIYTIIKIKRIMSITKKEELRKEIVEILKSKEMSDIIINAFNESEVSKKLNTIILLLCTHVPELKQSKLCKGEI